MQELHALVTFDKKKKDYKVVLPCLLFSCMYLCFMRDVQVSKDMTATDLLALVFKTHQTKPYTSPPSSFLVVQVNQGDGPPTKLTDETVLLSLYTNTHTLDYEDKRIAKNAPSPAKSPSPAKKPK